MPLSGSRRPWIAGGEVGVSMTIRCAALATKRAESAEFLAQMMGVRRTTVTEVASELQKAGMISYSRGRVRIQDVDLIRERACECDADVRSHYRRIFQSNKADVVPIAEPKRC
jgi:biotin operon repressor